LNCITNYTKAGKNCWKKS